MFDDITPVSEQLISGLQPFVTLALDEQYGSNWKSEISNAGTRATCTHTNWDLAALFNVVEQFWPTIWAKMRAHPTNATYRESEVRSAATTIRALRNRSAHRPKSVFSDQDALTFISLSENLLRWSGALPECEAVHAIYRQALARIASAEDPAHRQALAARRWIVDCRWRLWEAGKHYYRAVDQTPDWPLVAKRDWIPDEPLEIGRIDSALRWNASATQAPAPALPLFGGRSCSTFIKVASPHTKLENLFCYKVVSISEECEPPTITCGPSHYENYVDTCEALSFSLADWVSKHARMPDVEENDLPYHGPPERIFKYHWRDTLIGISALTIFNLSGEPRFILHRRSHLNLEAPNVMHVVPAGTFQPHASEDGFHARDFSMYRTLLRELGEEMFGMAELEAQDRRGADRIADHFKQLGASEDEIEIYYLGMGIDPVTLKMEALCCIVWKNLPYHLTKDNYEGQLTPVLWERETVHTFAEMSSVLPAGSACLALAEKHFEFLSERLFSA